MTSKNYILQFLFETQLNGFLICRKISTHIFVNSRTIATAIKPTKKFFVISETFGSEYFFDKIPERAHITTR